MIEEWNKTNLPNVSNITNGISIRKTTRVGYDIV